MKLYFMCACVYLYSLDKTIKKRKIKSIVVTLYMYSSEKEKYHINMFGTVLHSMN